VGADTLGLRADPRLRLRPSGTGGVRHARSALCPALPASFNLRTSKSGSSPSFPWSFRLAGKWIALGWTPKPAAVRAEANHARPFAVTPLRGDSFRPRQGLMVPSSQPWLTTAVDPAPRGGGSPSAARAGPEECRFSDIRHMRLTGPRGRLESDGKVGRPAGWGGIFFFFWS